MATIAEIRAKYPQYSDMPDAALADALHKKFYSDMPRSEFNKKIGLAPIKTEGVPGARQEPGIWETIRPYVAPTVEALGAAGGALVGGGAGALGGPVGAAAGGVAGAGLGYGIAKEALNLGDVYLGGKAPRQGMAAVEEPVRNVLEGATYEAGGRVVGQLAGPLISKAAGKVADIRQMPAQKAARIAKATLGEDLPVVLNNLRNAPANASVAELTAGIENPAWQRLIADSLKRDPASVQALRRMAIADESAATNALAKLAGGATAAETRTTSEAAKKAVSSITTPMREAALNRANLGKEVARLEGMSAELGEQAAGKVQEVRRLMELGDLANASARLNLIKKDLPVGLTKYTYSGELAERAFNEWSNKAAEASLDLGQGARFAQEAADALRRSGIKPLEGEPLVRSIQAVTRNPEYAGNDIMGASVSNLARDISQWTSTGGVIDARALDAIRKNSVNAAVRDLLKGQSPDVQRQAAAGAMSRLKPLIDDAIEAAGGTGYRDYLAQHAKMSQQIAEKRLTGEALNLWKTDKDAFVRLVQNESPEAVEKILGPGKYDIAKEVSDNTLSVLQDQAKKHLTKMSVKAQASEGGAALATVLEQEVSKFKLPSLLNFWSTVGNKTLDILEDKIGRKTMATLTEAAKTPGGVTNLLESLPANERNTVLRLIGNPQTWSAAGKSPVRAATIGSVNALSSRENQNSLAPQQ